MTPRDVRGQMYPLQGGEGEGTALRSRDVANFQAQRDVVDHPPPWQQASLLADHADAFPFVSRMDGADPIDMLRRREIAKRIQAALDALPPYHRSVILMRELEGMSYQEMAEAMQVSKGTIMSRLFHARQKLQRALIDCYREHQGREPGPHDKEAKDT